MMRKNSDPHKVGLYIRVSTEEQAANPEGSIKSQEQRLRQQLEFKNQDANFGNVECVYIDRAKSGADFNRAELQKLLNDIRTQKITMVLVTEISRLSRSLKDFCNIWDLMREYKCEFQSLREQFDSTTAAGEMVLFTVANIAQFERRQISERVQANVIARSQRGLYNGGCLPMGFRIDPEKKGYLLIDEEHAETVRIVFKVYLQEQTLKGAGKALNNMGLQISRPMQGGGRYRLGHFTIDNVRGVLTNKMYLGVKVYHVKGERRETKGVWSAIVDEVTFKRANEILKKNYRRIRFSQANRYPFLLSGLVVCGSCGDTMCGKSANGNGGKIPYYEHGWATKRQACLNKKILTCYPTRVGARKIEPRVWDEILDLLRRPELAKSLVGRAHGVHESSGALADSQKLKRKSEGTQGQIEALVEHLAKIPKGVSPAPIFAQMEKLEKLKSDLDTQYSKLLAKGDISEMPVALKSYGQFLLALHEAFGHNEGDPVRQKIISKLVHKIEIFPTGFKIHFYVGESRFYGWESQVQDLNAKANKKGASLSQASPAFFCLKSGSNSLTNGWGGRGRTCE